MLSHQPSHTCVLRGLHLRQHGLSSLPSLLVAFIEFIAVLTYVLAWHSTQRVEIDLFIIHHLNQRHKPPNFDCVTRSQLWDVIEEHSVESFGNDCVLCSSDGIPAQIVE